MIENHNSDIFSDLSSALQAKGASFKKNVRTYIGNESNDNASGLRNLRNTEKAKLTTTFSHCIDSFVTKLTGFWSKEIAQSFESVATECIEEKAEVAGRKEEHGFSLTVIEPLKTKLMEKEQQLTNEVGLLEATVAEQKAKYKDLKLRVDELAEKEREQEELKRHRAALKKSKEVTDLSFGMTCVTKKGKELEKERQKLMKLRKEVERRQQENDTERAKKRKIERINESTEKRMKEELEMRREKKRTNDLSVTARSPKQTPASKRAVDHISSTPEVMSSRKGNSSAGRRRSSARLRSLR